MTATLLQSWSNALRPHVYSLYMGPQYQVLLVAIGGAFVGMILTLLIVRPTVTKRAGKKRKTSAKSKRKGQSKRAKRVTVTRRPAIDTSNVTTHHDLPERTANPRDVAAYILQKIGPLTPMKLNRLISICQAAAIAEDGRPIFKEAIAASAAGPVPTAIFKEHVGQGSINEVPEGQVEMIVAKAQERIDNVLERCGNLDEQRLNRLTCTSPWKDARSRVVSGGADPAITHEELADVWKMISERLAA